MLNKNIEKKSYKINRKLARSFAILSVLINGIFIYLMIMALSFLGEPKNLLDSFSFVFSHPVI